MIALSKALLFSILTLFGFFFQKPWNTKWCESGKWQVLAFSHQQRFEVQHVFFPQDDEGGCATESVATVGLQAGHAAETTLPVLTAEHTEAAPGSFRKHERLGAPHLHSSIKVGDGELYLRIQLVVFSNSLGLRIFVSDATEAAQYALLKGEDSQMWVSRKTSPTLVFLLYF